MIFSAAMIMAVPAATVEREPKVPVPMAMLVGVAIDEADAIGRHSEPVAMIWRNVVAWPWP